MSAEEAVQQLITVAVRDTNDRDINKSIGRLKEQKAEAVPAIADGITQLDAAQRNVNTNLMNLIGVLGGISSDQATSELVRVVGLNGVSDEVVSYAMARLENRTVSRELTPQERAVIVRRIQAENVMSAGNAASIYAHCTQEPAASRMTAIVNRFAKELENPGDISTISTMGAYLSPRVLVRNRFILAMKDVGAEAAQLVHAKIYRRANGE